MPAAVRYMWLVGMLRMTGPERITQSEPGMKGTSWLPEETLRHGDTANVLDAAYGESLFEIKCPALPGVQPELMGNVADELAPVAMEAVSGRAELRAERCGERLVGPVPGDASV